MNQNWEQAARDGNASSLARQIASGCAINSLDHYGQSALMLAARSCHLDASQAVVDAQGVVNGTPRIGLNEIMLAVVNGHDAAARLLLAAGADLSIKGRGAPGFDGKTAADLARDRGLEQLALDLSR